MQYFVKAEFVEENIAGKPAEDVIKWIEMIIHPSLDMLQSQINGGKIQGGVAAGERVGYMIIDAPSHEAVGDWARSLPFWGAMRWTIVPLQSPKSAVEQDKAAFARARAMIAGGQR